VVVLDFDGNQLPKPQHTDRLVDRTDQPFKLDGRPIPSWTHAVWRVTVARRISHHDAGIQRLGSAATRPGDETFQAYCHTSWEALARELEFNLTGRRPPSNDG